MEFAIQIVQGVGFIATASGLLVFLGGVLTGKPIKKSLRRSTLPICIYEKYSKEKLRIGYFCNNFSPVLRLFPLNKEEERWVDLYGRYSIGVIENSLRDYQWCSYKYMEIRQKVLADYYGIRREPSGEGGYIWVPTYPGVFRVNVTTLVEYCLYRYIDLTIQMARINGAVYKEPGQVKMPPKYPKHCQYN